MQRVSSNLTLFFKIFIPIFWSVFFGAMLLAFFMNKEEFSFNTANFRIGAIVFYISGLVMYYLMLFRLKRVEFDAEFAYVSNYFKTFRYPWHNIIGIQETSFILFIICTMELKEGGHFGEKIVFIASRRHYREYMDGREAQAKK